MTDLEFGERAELELAARRLAGSGPVDGETRRVLGAWLECIAAGDPEITGLPPSPGAAREWGAALLVAKTINAVPADAHPGQQAADGGGGAVMEPGTLTDHVRRELALCGQFDEDPTYAAALVAAVAALMSYGHSGGSMGSAIEQLEVLLRRGTLTELTDAAAEWIDRSEESGYPMWQSARCPAAFSDDGGKTFWLLPNRDGLTGLPTIGEGRLVGVRNGRRFWAAAPHGEGLLAGGGEPDDGAELG